MLLIGSILALVVSFYLLAQVSDKYFIDSLDKIGKQFNMSHDMAGATLMAVGSSAPELFVAIIALIKPGGHEEIGIGTIVGSALFNILMIIGAAAFVKKSFLSWQPVTRDMVFYGISIIMLIIAFYDGKIVMFEAAIFVIFYGIYLVAVAKWRKIFPYEDLDESSGVDYDTGVDNSKWERFFKPFDLIVDFFFPPIRYYYMVFFISIIFIALLSWILVESAVVISHILQVPEVVIALTVLAVGTSVPDMISSVIVAKQGRGGMAFSNAVGSNIFDIAIGLGLPWLVIMAIRSETIPVIRENLIVSVIFLFASVLAIIIILIINKWSIAKKSGIVLMSLYLVYIIYEIIKAINAPGEVTIP